MKRSASICLATIWMIVVLSACAGSNANVVPLRPVLPDYAQQKPIGVQGDIVSLNTGMARIESTYISALGQPCRKLSLVGDEHKLVTECYDGEWHAVNEISGMSPVSR
ncbi:MAG: hypothetical protein AB9866_16620 [Syntrophobacteraceae bacterium]